MRASRLRALIDAEAAALPLLPPRFLAVVEPTTGLRMATIQPDAVPELVEALRKDGFRLVEVTR